ncbi:MBL fold metallo-hydrolase, partial [Klebsiella oxytoca]
SYADLLDAISEKGYRITLAKPGARYALGGAQLTILSPGKEYEDLNDTSVVTRIDYGERAFQVEGDAEEIAEEDMLEKRRAQPVD